jgi:digeranylgeranylglycerophospholipid reductase
MRPQYDIVVVGAGPAGSVLARDCAAAGLSVLLLEKDAAVGVPVRCGEAASERSLSELVDIAPEWIDATVTRFRLVAPNGCAVEPDIGAHGFILDRARFDAALADAAVRAGAECATSCFVHGLAFDGGRCSGVQLTQDGTERTVHARIVVGADGVESRVGRWAGINTVTRLEDMESCAQATIAGVTIDADVCEFHFGAAVAPMGYLWVFPKGRGRANVGVGISGSASKRRSAQRYLQDFLDRRFPDARIERRVAGGVPCAATVSPLVAGNVLVVGDAAHQVNPMSGGGITSGMTAARCAAKAAVAALDGNDMGLLASYERAWERTLGAKHRTWHSVKDVVYRFDDDALNAIAAEAGALKPGDCTLWSLFRIALARRPALLWELLTTVALRR